MATLHTANNLTQENHCIRWFMKGYTRINNNFYELLYRVYKLVFSKNIFSLFSQWPYSDVCHRVLSRGCRALQISEICIWLLLLLASCWKTYASTAAFLYCHTLFCIYILNCCVHLCSDYIPHKSQCLLKSMLKISWQKIAVKLLL